MKQVAESVKSLFKDHFHGSPEYLVRAPGRVNLIGEHTDYNMGYVLPVAIDRNIWVAFRPRSDDEIHLYSLDFNESIHIADLDSLGKSGNWSDYILGTVWELNRQGFPSRGWEGIIAGDIPIGAGLSSSAATEIAIALACTLASGFSWDPVSMAILGQKVERDWLGVRSGIMDQMVVANATQGYALLLDCRSLAMQHIPLPGDVSMAVLDTKTRRGLINSPYTSRVEECSLAAEFLGLPTLRNLDEKYLEVHKGALNETLYRRCRHVVTENRRVHQAVDALQTSQLVKLGRILQEGHDSLRDDFEVSGSFQNLIVEIANRAPGCLGARMTGAGFGGCAIALVKSGSEQEFKSSVFDEFTRQSGNSPEIIFCTSSAGASRELI
ncbi:MAG TPA: galactokinase [Anaerolineales bacterium]|nr:galactokinase [Anaerolineales bacterium]